MVAVGGNSQRDHELQTCPFSDDVRPYIIVLPLRHSRRLRDKLTDRASPERLRWAPKVPVGTAQFSSEIRGSRRFRETTYSEVNGSGSVVRRPPRQ